MGWFGTGKKLCRHGFRARTATVGGRKVIAARRARGCPGAGPAGGGRRLTPPVRP
ncbi:50S ribosomal protein L34 [Lacticaseibacillus rhamnosus]